MRPAAPKRNEDETSLRFGSTEPGFEHNNGIQSSVIHHPLLHLLASEITKHTTLDIEEKS
jgi:hypothetical protein